MGQLDGKVTIVTGAASGIGRASTQRFAAEGAKVIAADVGKEGLEETIDLVKSAGGEAHGIVADAGDEEAVKGLINAAQEKYGGLNGIYANAGISGGVFLFNDITVEMFNEVLRVNLVGPFLAIKYGAPVISAGGGGSIVCTASVAGLRSNAGPIPYSASKAGVISLVQTSAYNLYGSNVRVNAICPGLIETGMTKPMFDRAREKGSEGKIGQLNPMARYGHPSEIANAALFLISDESSYVNGQALPVCGGLSAGHPFAAPGRS